VALLALEYMLEEVCAGCSSSDELWAIMANSGAVHILQYDVDWQGSGTHH